MRRSSATGLRLGFSSMVFRMIIYSIIYSVALHVGWLNPRSSLVLTVLAGFVIWMLPQIIIAVFFRNKRVGFGKRWFIQGVVYAVLLTVFIAEGIIDPAGSYSMNLIAGLAIWLGSFLGGLVF